MPNRETDSHRAHSKKWNPTEVQQLLDAIHAQHCAPEQINWAAVAENVAGRTGKQCREKYKNDLRPDLSKAPWTDQEEYILARAHCQIGNQWAEIGQFLPGRSENTIKNKWNATLRAKADSKAHTLLWTYAQTWQAQDKTISLDVFEMAVHEFCRQNGQARIEEIKVPESYFEGAGLGRGGSGGGCASSVSDAAPQGGSQPQRSGRAPNAQQPLRKGRTRYSNRKRSRSAYDSEEEDEQAEEGWSDSEDEGARAAAKRPHTKRTGTSVIQQQLRRQRQQQQQQQQQEELERLELSRLPPPECMPPNFPLPTILPIRAPPQPPPPPSNFMIPTLAQQQQQQQQKPAAFPPRARALADITNLAHLSNMEPSATIKLCAPKHAQDSLKGFSFISDAAPQTATCQASQAGGQGIQGGGELGQQPQGQDVQGSMGLLLQQQLQQQGTALHMRTPGCKLGHAAAAQQVGSPAFGTGRPGFVNGPSPWLSPSLAQDVEYSSVLTDLGLEDFGNSPAAFRICNARPSDAFDQIPPLSVVKGRPSWMPEFDASYQNTLAMLQSPVSFMAQPPTQPVTAPGTCLATPRYTHVPTPVASFLGSPIPGPGPSTNAAAPGIDVGSANGCSASALDLWLMRDEKPCQESERPSSPAAPGGTSAVGVPALPGIAKGSLAVADAPGVQEDTSAAGKRAAALAAGVPALSGGMAPTPIRCPGAKPVHQGSHYAVMQPDVQGVNPGMSPDAGARHAGVTLPDVGAHHHTVQGPHQAVWGEHHHHAVIQTDVQGVHHAMMRPDVASLLSPMPPIKPLDRVHAHLSPRPRTVDRLLTLHSAACGQQTPPLQQKQQQLQQQEQEHPLTQAQLQTQAQQQHGQQQELPLLLGQSIAASLTPYFQAPFSAIKGQGTPRNAGLAQPSEAQPSLLKSAPGHPGLASLLQSPLPTGRSPLHRLHCSSSPFPRPFGQLMHNLQLQEQQQQQQQVLHMEQREPVQEQQQARQVEYGNLAQQQQQQQQQGALAHEQQQHHQGQPSEQQHPQQHGPEAEGRCVAHTHQLDGACLQQTCNSHAASHHSHAHNQQPAAHGSAAQEPEQHQLQHPEQQQQQQQKLA